MQAILRPVSTAASHWRRAISTTLQQWYDEAQILEALCMVEPLIAKSDTSNFGVIAIVGALSEHFGWNKRMRHDTRLVLYKNTLPNAVLGEDPIVALEAYKKTRAKTERKNRAQTSGSTSGETEAGREISAEHDVFGQLVYGLRNAFSKFGEPARREFNDALRDELNELNLPHAHERWLLQIMTHQGQVRGNPQLSFAQMSSIIGAIYNAVMDAIGPMAADRVLSHGVRLAEKAPSAAVVSPRIFL